MPTQPAELLDHVHAGPAVRRVHHEMHRAVGREHVAQRPQRRVGILEMVQNARADDLIETLAELADPLDRQLLHLEIGQVVLALEVFGAAHARRAEVDARHLGVRPAQGVLGRLRRPAAGDEDGVVFPK